MVLVVMLCYQDNMLSVDGAADAAVEDRVCKGWNKFRQFVRLLTNKDVSLLMRGKLYRSCVPICTLHGSETWPVKKQNEMTLQQAELRMITVNLKYNMHNFDLCYPSQIGGVYYMCELISFPISQ